MMMMMKYISVSNCQLELMSRHCKQVKVNYTVVYCCAQSVNNLSCILQA